MKNVPFSKEQIVKIAEKFPTPFHIYDEKAIRENAKRLNKAFSIFEGFKEYFAVKACPNYHLMKLLKEEGFGSDASSLAELILSEKAGITGEDIMFSSNNTPIEEFAKAKELGAIINLDDITHIKYLEDGLGLPELLSFRFNPGPLKGGNAIIGKPEDAKYGLTKKQLFEAYAEIKKKGVKRFGLHTMVASNELHYKYFVDTAKMLFEIAVELKKELDIDLDFINIGGGIGIPYKPDQKEVDVEKVAEGIRLEFDELICKNGLKHPKLYMECGRMVTGPFGYLVTQAIHKKEIYKNYIGVDACMANLMRPALYGAYHHITVLGKENKLRDRIYDVVGSLCENNDKFAIDRELPEIENGDFIVIHDAGAHGHAMGFNYNGKLRSAELLLKEDGSVKLIRRAETLDDYFATQIFE
ncbi:MAG TPA: diaminopimelate decarboxylase [Spirochaetota bacterium]|nr:diaminopimelate decarboxylase [Spirochaetota bacterium]HOF34447.1 diaminopimelate decarboxylase [Spirochaetota bacterium]HOR45301.1 diaminopimelate decarboxylase [Spirochaetota bacterium]HOU83877.1 diaminopimelate decarboxylase [Spirochaetota bacterium]HPK56609.1 diaminopimelate decarboxylase [Spirochaetota bacterium]